MLPTLFFLSSLLAISQAIPPPPIDPCHAYCADVYLVSCRATLEVVGEGQIGKVAEYVQHASSMTVERVALEYPALLEGYPKSAATGAEALKKILMKQVAQCPHQKIVLMGYSQGAQVIGDAISGGGGGQMGDLIQGLDSAIIDRITAVLLMGDPRHMAGEEYQHGTATSKDGDGVFPRTPEQLAILNKYKHKITSYCNSKDALCAVHGGGNLGGHYATISLFAVQAREWVLEMIERPASAGDQGEVNGED
ncbi:Cutinase [Drechslerella dactyloides]|uniref:Cutinase n=1 Tax=Drechslerella dactyloides TaxID=74499 RepID=A0AAD6J3U4_DREDA|nr:Cutinase [Drechslerella dactyloides]